MRVRRKWRRRIRRATAPAVVLIALALIMVTSWSLNDRGSEVSVRSIEQATVTAECLTATSVANVWCEPADQVENPTDPDTPVVSVARRISVVSTSGDPVGVAFNAVGQDLTDGTIRPTCVPAPGSSFSVGTTAVTCTATDSEGNVGIGRLEVLVTSDASAARTATGEAEGPADATSTGSDRSLWLLAGGSVLVGVLFLVLGERRRNRHLNAERIIDVRTDQRPATQTGVSQ